MLNGPCELCCLTARHIIEEHPPSPPADMPLVVCTPPELRMEFDWPSSLPWFDFRESVIPCKLGLNSMLKESF